MNIKRSLTLLVLPMMVLITGVSHANMVVLPALDIQDLTGDAGVTLSSTTFDIDATAFAIVTNGSTIAIPDEIFTLTATVNTSGLFSGLFTGSFTVGTLLSGTFDNLDVSTFDFFGDVTYTGGSLQGNLTTGFIDGVFSGSSMVAKLGEVAVVPVPAAAWLFGSGLIGLIGIARRKA